MPLFNQSISRTLDGMSYYTRQITVGKKKKKGISSAADKVNIMNLQKPIWIITFILIDETNIKIHCSYSVDRSFNGNQLRKWLLQKAVTAISYKQGLLLNLSHGNPGEVF